MARVLVDVIRKSPELQDILINQARQIKMTHALNVLGIKLYFLDRDRLFIHTEEPLENEFQVQDYFQAAKMKDVPNAASFTCPQCGRVSYHPKDAENKYCANCKTTWTVITNTGPLPK